MIKDWEPYLKITLWHRHPLPADFLKRRMLTL
jgi:hypothetical protein